MNEVHSDALLFSFFLLCILLLVLLSLSGTRLLSERVLR